MLGTEAVARDRAFFERNAQFMTPTERERYAWLSGAPNAPLLESQYDAGFEAGEESRRIELELRIDDAENKAVELEEENDELMAEVGELKERVAELEAQ